LLGIPTSLAISYTRILAPVDILRLVGWWIFYDVSIGLASYPTGEIASVDSRPERGEIASGHRRAQPPGEPLGGSLQASLVPMNVHTAARYPAPRIGHDAALQCSDAQKRALRVGASTADARPHRTASGP
jgi:hypothetical protein